MSVAQIASQRRSRGGRDKGVGEDKREGVPAPREEFGVSPPSPGGSGPCAGPVCPRRARQGRKNEQAQGDGAEALGESVPRWAASPAVIATYSGPEKVREQSIRPIRSRIRGALLLSISFYYYMIYFSDSIRWNGPRNRPAVPSSSQI